MFLLIAEVCLLLLLEKTRNYRVTVTVICDIGWIPLRINNIFKTPVIWYETVFQ